MAAVAHILQLTEEMWYRDNDPRSRLTADTLARHTDKAKSQLDAWCEEPQRHEQMAVGKHITGSARKIEKFFKDVNKTMKENRK